MKNGTELGLTYGVVGMRTFAVDAGTRKIRYHPAARIGAMGWLLKQWEGKRLGTEWSSVNSHSGHGTV
jgi:hypothetical protein